MSSISSPATSWRWTGQRSPFDDPKVRRAFAMALDREQLVEEILEGNATLANGLLPPGMPGYCESLRGIPYDPGGGPANSWPSPSMLTAFRR